MNSKSTVDDVLTILKLLNENEALETNQSSKTTVLIVANEIMSIIFPTDTFSIDNIPRGFDYCYYFFFIIIIK